MCPWTFYLTRITYITNRPTNIHRSRPEADDPRFPVAVEGGGVGGENVVSRAARLAAAVGGRHGAGVADGEAREGAQEGGQFQASHRCSSSLRLQ